VVAQNRLQQERIRTGRDAIDGVVTAHNRAHFCVTHAGLEGREVEFRKILLRDDGVERETLVTLPILNVVPSLPWLEQSIF
jgi:hypothetical protein